MTLDVAEDAVLELRGVSKSFAEAGEHRRVLGGVELALRAGEIVVVAGRSGSGKTTLLSLVAGLEEPDAGEIHLFGAPARSDQHPWTEVAFLAQSLALLDELTVAENVGLPLRLADVPGAADPDELMGMLGVGHLAKRYPDEISLGEQQRVALARSVIVRPRLLLADEPISHQNDAWSNVMMDLLVDVAEMGTTCLLATHNAAAFRVADRVLELRGGRLHSRP